MDQFVRLENFKLIAPYAELFWQGMLVTILLALFTVVIGFLPGPDPGPHAHVKRAALPGAGPGRGGAPQREGISGRSRPL